MHRVIFYTPAVWNALTETVLNSPSLHLLRLDWKRFYSVTFIINVASCRQCLWFIRTIWRYTNLVLLLLLILTNTVLGFVRWSPWESRAMWPNADERHLLMKSIISGEPVWFGTSALVMFRLQEPVGIPHFFGTSSFSDTGWSIKTSLLHEIFADCRTSSTGMLGSYFEIKWWLHLKFFATQLDVNVSQGTVVTHLMCCGSFNDQFTAECTSERILSIHQYLMRLWQQNLVVSFV